MANRRIFNAEAVYAGPSPATGFHFDTNADQIGDSNTGVNLVRQIHRVQSASFNASTPRVDIFQFGQLAPIDRIAASSPDVSVDFTYLVNSLANERSLGFTVSSGTLISALSGMMTNATDERNLFFRIAPEGQDAIANLGAQSSFNTFAFGNMAMSSYSVEAAVGDFPRASVTFEGINVNVDTGVRNTLPAVDTNAGTVISNRLYELPIASGDPNGGAGDMGVSVLRPGDIQISLGSYNELGVDVNDWKIQSFSLSAALNRNEIEKLGSRFAVSRTLQFPIDVQCQFTAVVGDFRTGSLQDLVNRNTPYDITITMNRPQFSRGVATSSQGAAAQYILRQAYLDTQSQSLDIGSNKTVTLSFMCGVSGPQETGRGFFISGLN